MSALNLDVSKHVWGWGHDSTSKVSSANIRPELGSPGPGKRLVMETMSVIPVLGKLRQEGSWGSLSELQVQRQALSQKRRETETGKDM